MRNSRVSSEHCRKCRCSMEIKSENIAFSSHDSSNRFLRVMAHNSVGYTLLVIFSHSIACREWRITISLATVHTTRAIFITTINFRYRAYSLVMAVNVEYSAATVFTLVCNIPWHLQFSSPFPCVSRLNTFPFNKMFSGYQPCLNSPEGHIERERFCVFYRKRASKFVYIFKIPVCMGLSNTSLYKSEIWHLVSFSVAYGLI